MSDQEPKPNSAETGSVSAGISHSADAPGDQAAASAAEASPAKSAPASEAGVSEPIMPEPSMSGPALSEVTKVEPAKAEASALASEPQAAPEKVSATPGKVIVMSRGEHAWADQDTHVGAEEATANGSMFGKRRMAAIAAVVALAAVVGALGGAFATATFMHGGTEAAKAGPPTSLEASLSRIDADIQSLKTGLDHTSKLGMNQFNKTTDRLDKLERAQAEPAARLAKLSEAVDKLRGAAPVATPVAAAATPAAASAAKEVTGSIGPTSAQQQAAAQAPKSEAKIDAKTEVARLPTLEDWVLRDVAYGGALIGSRRGTYEVYAGDTIPGLGRVDAIRRQDGRWVVVTSRGLIVAR